MQRENWESLCQQFWVGSEESGVQIIKLSSSYARLAQGHARLLNHDQVTICDAINAIILLEVSYDSNPSFLPEINLLHTSFPTDPFEEYKNQAEYILTELGLVELWVGEQKRLDRAATSVRDKNQNSDLNNARENIPEADAVASCIAGKFQILQYTVGFFTFMKTSLVKKKFQKLSLPCRNELYCLKNYAST